MEIVNKKNKDLSTGTTDKNIKGCNKLKSDELRDIFNIQRRKSISSVIRTDRNVPSDKIRYGNELEKYFCISCNPRPKSDFYVGKMLNDDPGIGKTLYGIYCEQKDLYYITDGQHVCDKEMLKGVDKFDIGVLEHLKEGDLTNHEKVFNSLRFGRTMNKNNRKLNAGNDLMYYGTLRRYHDKYIKSGNYSKWIHDNTADHKEGTIRNKVEQYEGLVDKVYGGTHEYGDTLLEIICELNLGCNAIIEIKNRGDLAMDEYIKKPEYNEYLRNVGSHDNFRNKIKSNNDYTEVSFLVKNNSLNTLKDTVYHDCMSMLISNSFDLFAEFIKMQKPDREELMSTIKLLHNVEILNEMLSDLNIETEDGIF